MLSCFPFVHKTSSFSKGRDLSCFCRTQGCYRLGNLREYNRAGAAKRPIACTVHQYRPLNATHSATFQSKHGHTPVLGVPFSASSEHRVLLINLWVVVNHLEELILQTLVPASTFLHALGTLAPGEIGAILRRTSGARAGHSSWGPRGRRGPRRCAMCTVRRSRPVAGPARRHRPEHRSQHLGLPGLRRGGEPRHALVGGVQRAARPKIRQLLGLTCERGPSTPPV